MASVDNFQVTLVPFMTIITVLILLSICVSGDGPMQITMSSTEDAAALAVIMGQPRGMNEAMKAFSGDKDRDWHSGPCGCCTDCKTSCCFCWCPCVFQCLMARRIRESVCVPWFVPGGMIAMRTRMRSKLDIKGTVCGDCCCVMLCGPLAACQMSRELDSVGIPNIPFLSHKEH